MLGWPFQLPIFKCIAVTTLLNPISAPEHLDYYSIAPLISSTYIYIASKLVMSGAEEVYNFHIYNWYTKASTACPLLLDGYPDKIKSSCTEVGINIFGRQDSLGQYPA